MQMPSPWGPKLLQVALLREMRGVAVQAEAVGVALPVHPGLRAFPRAPREAHAAQLANGKTRARSHSGMAARAEAVPAPWAQLGAVRG